MSSLPSLVAFGSLASWPSREQLQQLQGEFQRKTALFEPLKTAIQDLPAAWQSLLQEDGRIHPVDGQDAAESLARWIQGSADALGSGESRSMVALPMTILTQIVQYLNVLENAGEQMSHRSMLESVSAGGGIQGFCAGLLSALAVASATSEEETVVLAATSVRLAFLVGVYVDLDQTRDGRPGPQYTSLAVRWRDPTTVEDIRQILLKHPDTYLSVLRDVRDVTITAPTEAVGTLQADLSGHGVTWLGTGLHGRYHSSLHRDVPAKIVNACRGQLHPEYGRQKLVRSNDDAGIIAPETAVRLALECILARQANWHLTMSRSTAEMGNRSGRPEFILSIGTDAVPQSIAKRVPVVKMQAAILPTAVRDIVASAAAFQTSPYPEHAVAVIGMACKFPGADSIDEFWRLLTAGHSMLSRVPAERFDLDTQPRSKGLAFWGNFVRDIEAFDHKFFRKSAREAASMDPQQRLLLQVAYQALESSGYFSDPARPRDIGCYLGACSTDYDGNVGAHPPTAYSTIGTLRAFLSGRLSHHFGWSGPSLVFDTACSSSAVAIHTACTALAAGECSQAVAGGVTLITTPYLYENLSAAHFLSPTGATKSFDAAADGYCRGEGVGLVVLKRLSDAIAHGDNILGVVTGSAVNQNANCVSITVPHSPSQCTLYGRVANQSGINPHNVTFVEAHGTGTPVGDPIEMESIRQVFGGPKRTSSLFVSSVKGNIGHLEGASGVAALIKALLQMENRTACVQASFDRLNPRIPPLGPDNMSVPTSNRPLQAPFITACINNYGAAGSNATLILAEKPRLGNRRQEEAHEHDASPVKLPIQISAASAASVARYCQLLDEFGQTSSTACLTTANLAFSLARQQNQELPHMLTTVTTDTIDVKTLCSELKQKGSATEAVRQRPKELPVVLCFGGQVGQQVGLSKRLWKGSALFRSHLDACDTTLRALGYDGIYPAVFEKEPLGSVVTLQSAIFATQYASARTWLDSGLRVDGLVGHSLGQFAALCVSGILSLADGLRLVAGRASLMQKHWGPEPGTMLAVEADRSTMATMMANVTAKDARFAFETACYNGPTSQVVVSDEASADVLQAELARRAVRHRKLNVTNGFHSRFTDPLIPHLEALASTLTLGEAKIPIETCTEGASWPAPSARLIAAHTRDPVFFGQAVQRLQDRLGTCTFIEAGSGSSVVSMVRRALSRPAVTGSNNFVPVDLNTDASLDNLAELTVSLWNLGHQFQFWNFHRLQAPNYQVIRLPPYAFEKTKHWLEYKPTALAGEASVQPTEKDLPPSPPPPPVLLRFKGIDSAQCQHFDVNPRSAEFQALVKGHVVLGKAQCPPSLYVELVTRALKIARQGLDGWLLSVHNMAVLSPVDLDTDAGIELELRLLGDVWNFKIASTTKSTSGSSSTISHVTGFVSVRETDSVALRDEFARYQRLTHDPKRISAIHNDENGTFLRGAVVYKIASRFVEYADFYRNVVSVASSGGHVVGKVVSSKHLPLAVAESAKETLALDGFLQVASLHANHMQESANEDDIFHLSSVERIQYGPKYCSGIAVGNSGPDVTTAWDVLCIVSSDSGSLVSDIFVYDAMSGKLAVLLLGVCFVRVDHVSVRESLTLAVDPVTEHRSSAWGDEHVQHVASGTYQPQTTERVVPVVTQTQPAVVDPKTAIFEDVCVILEKIAEIPGSDVRGNASFEDVGVDSLMMIEVIGEISGLYNVELPLAELEELTDFDSLVRYLHSRGCRGAASDDSTAEEEGQSSGSSVSPSLTANSSAGSSPIGTPATCSFATPLPTPHSQPIVGGLAPDVDDEKRLPEAQQVFDSMRFDFDTYADQTGFSHFWETVYPEQAALVEAYILDAFRTLGSDLACLTEGQPVRPPAGVLPKHDRLMSQLFRILADGDVIITRLVNGSPSHVRTAKAVDPTPATVLFERMLQKHPQHESETRLLNVTGSRMAECLAGKADPLQLLFVNRANRAIMADVYAKAPMCRATSCLLADYLERSFSACDRVFKIIEVGAGTGGTARYLVDYLARHGVQFEYTFTDISSSLVGQAKKTFAGRDMMRFATLDCDQPPPEELRAAFDVVVATNCIHATKNASMTAVNMASLLRHDGVFCLVEFTRGLYWFDLVYGLLEGWWAFSDGRQHALADQWFWDRTLRTAGFRHVSWTDGSSDEARTMRIICGFPAPAQKDTFTPLPRGIIKRAGLPVETFQWKQVGRLDLMADVYYPKTADEPGRQRPVALMIHGGGHLLFSRRDIPMKHVRVLLQRGYLPVSVDYRLCPELSLFEGPVTDCRDALEWVRNVLPALPLSWPNVQVDPRKVLALGWSSGGQLAMTLGYTAVSRGVRPPDVILPFYSPSDLEAEFWDRPIFPEAAEEPPQDIWGELDCVREEPIVEYTPMSDKRATALSLTLKDDRARLILHMNWKAQSVPVLIRGLPHMDRASEHGDVADWKALEKPPVDQIRQCSPFWHILQGDYRTPTFMVHGNADDWIPYQMTERTIAALRERGVPCGILIPEQCGHAFDLFPKEDRLGVGWAAIEAAYDFADDQLQL